MPRYLNVMDNKQLHNRPTSIQNHDFINVFLKLQVTGSTYSDPNWTKVRTASVRIIVVIDAMKRTPGNWLALIEIEFREVE